MFFKSIQIQGFKSFVNKTLIEFPKGITAIVGPNGSGKSNIMDALRWVFGEQRASELRGGDMGDVIFAGSEKRRGAGYAEVTLTMSELPSETAAKWGTFSEVSVTRKIYSSGEREYLINNRRCRLKDIRDIFFDTGLGSRSISIIEQERVTKIVNSSPDELRYFLEETAGVIRYKERRKEAEIRLRQTQDNLSRISDIISIMQDDIERLSAQVKRLNRYRELRDKKNMLEKAFICVTYARLNKEKTNINEQLNITRNETVVKIGQNQSQIDKEQKLTQQKDALVQTSKELRKSYELTKDTLAKAESDIRQYRSAIENAARERLQIENDISACQKRISEMDIRKDSLESNLDDTADLCEEFAHSVEECLENVSQYKGTLDRANDEMKTVNRKYLDITQKFTDFTNKINLKEAESANHKTTYERLLREKNATAQDGESIQTRLTEAKEKLFALDVQLDELAHQTAVADEKKSDKQNEYELVRDICADLEIEINSASGRIEFLQNEINGKLVSAESAEIVTKFGGKPYIDTTEKREQDYLLYSDLFIFENSVKDELLRTLDGADISIRFVFSSDIHIFSADNAEKIGKGLYKHGVIYRKAGKNDPMLAVMHLRERIQNEITARENLCKHQNEKQKKLSDIEDELRVIDADFVSHSEKIKNLELEHNSVQTNITNLDEQHKRLNRNIGVIDKEITLALDGITIADNEAVELKNLRETLSDERQAIEDTRLALEDRLEHFTELLEEAREKHSGAVRELTRYTERKAAVESELAQLQKDHENALEIKEDLEDRLSNLAEISVKQWQEALVSAEKTKENANKEVIIAADKVALCEDEQMALEQELAELRAALGHINKELHELDIKIAEMTGKIETISVNMSALAAQMQDVYGEDIESVWQNYAANQFSKQRVQEEMAYIDVAIDELGALNMAAEDEYTAKKVQHSEHVSQQEDINLAIDRLNDLIMDIDNSTVQLFEETFRAVRNNFIEVFTRFFGSGSADLRLTDPDNLLTTGVELYINPPGKRVSNKNLLSGGEKALAALTLLFALFLQRPTPFCFLDEVDAPLDDANAARFITMVRSLADQTQFIIITHKHQTMAAADSLYGVTMQEGGVSTILSVELC